MKLEIMINYLKTIQAIIEDFSQGSTEEISKVTV